jgi:hypothetical protein
MLALGTEKTRSLPDPAVAKRFPAHRAGFAGSSIDLEFEGEITRSSITLHKIAQCRTPLANCVGKYLLYFVRQFLVAA